MLTSNSNIKDDFFNGKTLLGKTIDSIAISQEADEDAKYISVYFTDCSCLEFVLNLNDVFYMEPVQ